jgi:glyoxylase-like metal-dependent hydrolase (beta-lactamase superfamily II)
MTSVEILVDGFSLREASGVWHISSNVTLVHDDDILLLVDLGAPDRQQVLLDALNCHGIEPGDIDSIVLTHLHIDHVGALGLFPGTHIILPEGTATGSRLRFCNPTALHPSPHTFVLRVPGHTTNDIALGLHSDDGTTTVVAGDLFPVDLNPDSPITAVSLSTLALSRRRVLDIADFIVTGHGPVLPVNHPR